MYLQVSLGVLMMLTLVTITAQVEAPLPQVPYLKVITKIRMSLLAIIPKYGIPITKSAG